jgi:hypothetical protein
MTERRDAFDIPDELRALREELLAALERREELGAIGQE